MWSTIISKRTALLVIIAELTLSAALMYYLIPNYFTQESHTLSEASPIEWAGTQVQSGLALIIENTVPLPKQKQAPSGLPVRLKIPGIHVDSPIEGVGLLPDGVMDVPKGPSNVAWYNLGPLPGEKGSAVIAGHYGWKDGKVAVFDNLFSLQKGDKVYVENDKGVITSFVVREIRRYDPSAGASEVFGSNDGNAHLNLITCEGAWNEAQQSYSNRLVVFTDKE